MFRTQITRALTLATVLSLVLTSVALADTVSNSLDNTVDNAAETMALTAGGSSGSTFLYVSNTNNTNPTFPDTTNACNLNGAATLTISVASSAPTKATAQLVSPTDDAVAKTTFNDCQGRNADGTFPAGADLIKVLVTPLAAGPTTITVSQVSTTAEASADFYYGPATFTVNVSPPPDSTAPTITPNIVGTLGSNGWYTSDVGLSWTVSDPDSAITSQTGCGTTNITADQPATDYTCSATSAGGTNSVTVSIKRDATAPTVNPASVNDTTWRNSSLSQVFTASDAPSGLADASDASFTLEASAQSADASTPTTVSKTVFDNAGNSTSRSVSALIDRTDPSISASLSPAAASTGWYNIDTGAATVSFLCSDTLSGLAGACPAAHTFGEGADQSYSRSILDNAGNSNSAGVTNVDVDLQAPTVALVGGPADGASYVFGSVPAAPTCSASDGLSGLAGACSVSGYSAAVGTHTVTASATDNAGNTASDSASYTVLAWTLNGFYSPVDMGITNTVKGGSTVPLKFEIFAGSTELTSTSAIKSFTVTKTGCEAGALTDDIEIYSTGGTSLRYDSTGGQFIQNWQTPKGAGICYRVVMTTQDLSALVAIFQTK